LMLLLLAAERVRVPLPFLMSEPLERTPLRVSVSLVPAMTVDGLGLTVEVEGILEG